MSVHPAETYLHDLSEIHRTGGGTAEESYYGALQTLLDGIGAKLTPKVRCVPQLRNTGGGEPDFGLYTANQFQRIHDDRPLASRPERGVIECKPWNDDSITRVQSPQISKYLAEYSLVLVTNYRDFVLVARDSQERAAPLETFRLAESESAFRAMLANPRQAARERGDRLVEFLRRVMLHAAPLTDPEDLAWFLASYAREARARVEEAAGLPALAGLKKALEEALGMRFEGEKGEHFFRATLIQTLFYGVFSSWVLWARNSPPLGARFNWHEAGWTLHVPMVRSLFEQIATPNKLKPLRVDEVLDWAGLALNRVKPLAFFEKFEEEHAVQYFYEPFLKAYDPELRKELGVWYTPPEIVQYQVERVDRVLREELGLADGLADEQVVVLDPCCGTGAYLVETLKRIHKTLEERGASALTAQRLKQAAMKRVFGFEILPAPFVVAHLQLGLMLRLLGAPFDSESDERAGVYLTNALTGWEPPAKPKDELPLFPELMEERDAANRVKRETPILVILGNPPYNGFAGTALDEERDLVTAYRTTKLAPKPVGQGLNDLYVRFFRMAERRIVDKSGKGVICYISNYSWLEGLSHTGMREHFLEVFDRIWIDNLHGDRIISEYAPDGKTSETVFAMGGQAPGIKIGTAISLFVSKKAKHHTKSAEIYYQDFEQAKAADRRLTLLSSARHDNEQVSYCKLTPHADIGFPYKPAQLESDYLSWPLLPDLFPVSFPGVKTSRDEFLVDVDRDALEKRIATYFDPNLSHEEIARRWPSVMNEGGRYRAREIRTTLLKRGRTHGTIVRYAYRPFDVRWLYWEPETKLLDEKRSEYYQHVFEGNMWLEARQKHPQVMFDRGYVTTVLCDNFGNGLSNFFPMRLKSNSDHFFFSNEGEAPEQENLSEFATQYLEEIRASLGDLFFHVIAMVRTHSYMNQNNTALRLDWPRIPLPASREALLASAALGRRVAALLDTEKPVEGVTRGKIRPELKSIAIVSKVGGGALDPAAGELDLTAGWGHAGQGGVCMPGKGRAEPREQPDDSLRAALGASTLDVYLNPTAYWANVPEKVWDYTIGGYQVIKKWLSYREKALLGRGLTLEEAEYVTEMARRLAALILLQPELDANYQAVKSATWPWPGQL